MPTSALLPEAKAIDTIAKTIDGLDDAEQYRVLAWIQDRYMTSFGNSKTTTVRFADDPEAYAS